MFKDAVELIGNVQKSFTQGGQSEKLPIGTYAVWASSATYIKAAPSNASDVTTTTGFILRADTTIYIRLNEPAFIGSSGSTGNVFYHKIG